MNVDDRLRMALYAQAIAFRPGPEDWQDVEARARRGAARRRERLLASVAAAAIVLVVVAALALRSGDGQQRVVAGGAGPSGRGGALIAFARGPQLGGPNIPSSEIYAVSPNTGSRRQLTRAGTRGRVAAEPAWSPDGRLIAFVESTPRHLGAYAGSGDLWIMRADGSQRRQLTHTNADAQPAWSPDGKRLAFVRFGNGGADIYQLDLQTNRTRRLTRIGAMSPSWSPDGLRLAFTTLPTAVKHVYVMSSDGTGITQLTHGVEEYDPAWSPDGASIAFGSSTDSSLYLVRPDGGGMRRLTTCAPPGCLADLEPSWSPDASRLVFARDVGGRAQLYVVRTNGSDLRPLTVGPEESCCPSW
jgi:TolB protein